MEKVERVEFKIGDLVTLKGYNLMMVVNEVGLNDLECIWLDETSNIKISTFKVEVIKEY